VIPMNKKGWFVINIRVSEKDSENEDFLIRLHSDVVSKFKGKLESWHFLWEGSPFSHTLLMRVFGNPDTIGEIGKTMTKLLDEEGIEWKVDEEYGGEAKAYGTKGWEYLMKVLHLGSDFAIDIIENERKGEGTEEFKRSLGGYLERWIHLFNNQLCTRVKEDTALFHLSVHRTAVYMLGEKEYRKISEKLDKEISQFLRHSHDEKRFPLISSLLEKRYT